MRVQEIMNTHVRTATAQTSVRDVAVVMCFNKISGVPVVDDERRIVGMISEKDILNAMYPSMDEYMQKEQAIQLEGLERSYSDLINMKVADLMKGRVMTVSSDAPVLKAVSVMNVHKIRRIPVADDGRLVGIVSIGDVHKAKFMQHLDCMEAYGASSAASEAGETEKKIGTAEDTI